MTNWDTVLSPISDVVTNQIRVEVLSRHSPERSKPTQSEWIFEYTIRITNRSLQTVQLVSRHWIITDALNRVREVQGPGVVGKQPVLAPGESFQYSSWCSIETPTGMMRGTYQIVDVEGKQFDIEIAPFALRSRQTIH
ncbi:MAG TPA: Co2+/Mg2+ efflux protein ApaG [Bryobacteraceae bacterium]|nr:Co2+/Mg2+ efflux protein ApaG [Bryobacteraceae bacterium]